MSKMKLLYFLPHITNSGGMERIVIDKINYLVNQGNQVCLAYFGDSSDISFFPIHGNVKRIAMREREDSGSFAGKLKSVRKLISTLCHVIESVQPDVIVNANVPVISWILPFVKKSIPKIVELHFSYDGMMIMNQELYGGNKLKSSFNNFLRRFLYPKYDRCVLLTDADKLKWSFKNAEVIPNFTNLNAYRKTDLNNKKAVCVGRLDPPKNIDLLIKAWAFVKKEVPEWELDIYGDGMFLNDYTKLIEEMHLEDVVHLKGVSSDLSNVYPYYSFFVLPSRYEGFPLVLVEAMQFGLPCVGFDITGNTTVIQNGKNGLIVKERDEKTLAKAILKLIKSPETLGNMSVRSVSSVQKYDKDKVMQMWENLFSRLIYDKRGCL